MMKVDRIIIGAGIVGLATAWQLKMRRPTQSILLLEKEGDVGLHQSSRNSGVLHTGIYYRPGSTKARNCMDGRKAMIEFCTANRIAFEVCGKLIVATDQRDLPRLAVLRRRAEASAIECEQLGPEDLRTIEPHARGIAALHVPGAGIVDYGEVTRILRDRLREDGVQVKTGCLVEALHEEASRVVVQTRGDAFNASEVINCAGLFSDRMMSASGASPPVQIVPFRGEYYALRDDARRLCRHLIYPVPDPAFPFLGVHFTRTIDGHVEAGPNAVLAFAREGYSFGTFNLRDVLETLRYVGFRRLAAQHWRVGLGENWRALNKRAFTRALQRLVPEVRAKDLVRTQAGVRAQAVGAQGQLVDDFLIERSGAIVHVLNAPSPAATSAFAIGAGIADLLCDVSAGG